MDGFPITLRGFEGKKGEEGGKMKKRGVTGKEVGLEGEKKQIA